MIDKAIADWIAAIQLDPTEQAASVERGVAWFDKKEYDKAIADLTEVIRRDSKCGLPTAFAAAPGGPREYDRAVSDYIEAIRFDPNQLSTTSIAATYGRMKPEHNKTRADYDIAARMHDPEKGIAMLVIHTHCCIANRTSTEKSQNRRRRFGSVRRTPTLT